MFSVVFQPAPKLSGNCLQASDYMLGTLLQLFPGPQNWVLQKGLLPIVCQNWASYHPLFLSWADGCCRDFVDGMLNPISILIGATCNAPATGIGFGEKKSPHSTCHCNVAAQTLPLPIALERVLFVQKGVVVLGLQKAKEIPHPSMRTSK